MMGMRYESNTDHNIITSAKHRYQIETQTNVISVRILQGDGYLLTTYSSGKSVVPVYYLPRLVVWDEPAFRGLLAL